MRIFAVLVCAHILGDFLFQTHWIASRKARLSGWFLHTLIHGLLIYVVSMQASLWLLPVVVAVLHGGIDAVKVRLKDTPRTFAVDQAVHLGALGMIAIVLNDSRVTLTPDPYYAILVWISGYVAVTCGAGFAVSKVAKQLMEDNDLRIDGLKHGGACIGILERTLIFLFILIGQPGAIGFLVAAKSILRFEEAKKQKLAEYVLIGTLLSFTLAISLTHLTMRAAAL